MADDGIEQRDVPPWHTMEKEAVIKALECPDNLIEVGLTDAQAAASFEKHGPNRMTESKKKTMLEKIWEQVANVLVLILLIVAAVSMVRGIIEKEIDNIVSNWIQFGIILSVIGINTWIGIYQEGNAEKAAEALKSMLSSDARVVRNGKECMIPGENVVPGDIVILGLGDKIPCDMRLVSVSNMASGEAALTGESVPIDKITDKIDPPEGLTPQQVPLGDRKNMCYSATLIAQGSGRGIAIATGDYTEIGTINALVSKVEKKKTAVLQQIDNVSKILAVFIIITSICTFFAAMYLAKLPWLDSVQVGLVCAVAMIPEGLEAIVTVVYAWAVSNMATQNAIIRALPAVETLGSVTVICSDKTGTLTQNIMSLVAFVTSDARWKIDVNAETRTPDNFVRDDAYMSERAQHQLKRSVSKIIKDGANSDERRRGKQGASNHFAVQSLHDVNGGDEGDEEKKVVANPEAQGKSPDQPYVKSALAGGILCSHCILGENGGRKGEIGNPTELSILRAVYMSGVDIEDLKKEIPIVAEVPFSSEYKFMATVHKPNVEVDGDSYDGKLIVHAKGAPDRMLKLCNKQSKGGSLNTDEYEDIDTRYWTEQIATLSSHGLRVIGLTRGEIPEGEVNEGDQLGPEFVNGRDEPWLTMVGLCAIMDPPRPECVQAITEARQAGVRVAMITGDHKDTATAIGHMLGIVDEQYSEAVTGPELDAMDDDQIKEAVMTHNVFARASPQNKIRIVKALQAMGQVSSMTGDGVNDAPALKAADMGVAMGKEGTDVAREASEMILADDNFATIVVAVREGRVVWDNLRKILLVNTPINNAQGMSVLFGILCGLPNTPLTAIQVLYSNLICAVTLGFVCAIEPAEDGIMDQPPRKVGKRLIGRYLFLRIALATATLTLAVVGSVFWARATFVGAGYSDKVELQKLRSQAINTLDFGAIGVTLSARFAYNSAFHPRIFKGNKFAWYSVAIVAVLQVAITYIPGLNSVIFGMGPMTGTQWGITFLMMFVVFFVMEAEKMLRRGLKAQGKDTDDKERWVFDETEHPDQNIELPKGASHLNLTELNH
mmetsp:Transcript_19101/g.55501  ORF Transcript_19101/g.55501 Transcript_19101/m.55501 type:complete len:1061 (-) Transcript_19101:278-3460(-)|eukprot:CAMPEP_0113548054 /NCGR_PEP_ID=MMETSP0015_2-20120614/12689_1 /TAXON_ID=2838 /ORGANISM="Odontella" /LENGTH=1060 /DNA_ID=CAMNT_0000448659 /DNA_START=139 /DNA_END=3321 /DNA_ORIENTATION=- /assembly_acc=CAM_ASM_000160